MKKIKLLVVFTWFVTFSVQAETKLIKNAKVWTGNPDQPWASSVLIEDNRIAQVGGDEVINKAPKTIAIIDAHGKLVLPGFIDNHVHWMAGGSSLIGIKTQDSKTKQEFIDTVKKYSSDLPRKEWILGGQWDHQSWGGELPNKSWIDAFTPENPLFLNRTDNHMAIANSAALVLAGITKDTLDPEGGLILRDENGEPTGVLKDEAMSLVQKVIPKPSLLQKKRIFEAATKEALRNGVTQVHSIGLGIWDNLDIYHRAKTENRIKVRTYLVPHHKVFDQTIAYIDKYGKGDNWLRLGGIKVMADGALGSSTAWFYEPYIHNPTNSGFPLMPIEELKKIMAKVDNHDLQLVVHGIGDRANDEVLNIFEELKVQGKRPRIEHAQHLSKLAFTRFKELGVIVAGHPYHICDDGRYAQARIGFDRSARTYAFKSLLNENAMVSFGSDWPVAPISPILGIYAAVTRQTTDGKNPTGWFLEQKVSVEQAVKAYTVNSAYAGNKENLFGSIEPGKIADIVILNDDIFSMEPEKIKSTSVVMTIIDGKIEYQAK